MRKKKKMGLIGAGILLLQLSFTAQAWDATGHMIIAKIAYDHLTPTAKQDIDLLFEKTYFAKDFPAYHSYVLSAPWPDYFCYSLPAPKPPIKSIFNFLRLQTKPWHYIDDPVVAEGVTPPPVSSNNSMTAMHFLIPNLSALLAGKKYDLAIIDIVFITHIIGDIHQPLHDASLYENAFPRGDWGGNAYKIQSTFGARNLHSAWDKELGEFRHKPTLQYITEKAAQLESDEIPPKANDLNPLDWEKSSHEIAQDFVYPIHDKLAPQPGKSLSDEYIEKGQAIVNQQLILAGMRLAGVLNGTLKEPIEMP